MSQGCAIRTWNLRSAWGAVLALVAAGAFAWLGAGAVAAERSIPRPLPAHPGNIFVMGEPVVVAVPAGSGDWRVLDYEGKVAGTGSFAEGRASLGRLPVGYYEVRWGEGRGPERVSVGVLEPLHAPTPAHSPIGIDVAMAWFYPKEQMAAPANLCTLAGLNRVRDRYLWPELEPKRGDYAAATRSDASAQAQAQAGLQVLQVGHCSPAWANPNTKRFPLDLRDTYNFHRELARRWRGQVAAFEPWNEADIDMFGGHTGSEMAALQKAAYLGIKAGNPDAVVCLNVLALHRASTLRDLAANEAWPYFDTFNLHHYEALKDYPRLYADFRAVSAGRPLWVSECSVHVKWSGDEQAKELSDEDLRLQSERLTKTFALALHERAEAVFYFMLPHYTENQSQFGVIKKDLSPRPAFVALAAAGRLLAGAKPLGRLTIDGSGQAYVFEAQPDGRAARVVVGWAEPAGTLELPLTPPACFDHLGRPLPAPAKTLKLGSAPLYAVLPADAALTLAPPPKPAPWLAGVPGPVVLQALLPEKEVVVAQSAYQLAPGATRRIPICLYNFGPEKYRGRLAVVGPAAWKITLPSEAEIAPGERRELTLELACDSAATPEGELRLSGDFGAGGQPVLALRFVPGATAGSPTSP